MSTKNAQLVANWIAQTINTGDVVFADGKVVASEYFALANSVMGIAQWLPVRKEALAEWEGANNDEKAAMIQSACNLINLENDKLEAKFEAGFAIVVHIGTLLG